jgi:hypothetical protein
MRNRNPMQSLINATANRVANERRLQAHRLEQAWTKNTEEIAALQGAATALLAEIEAASQDSHLAALKGREVGLTRQMGTAMRERRNLQAQLAKFGVTKELA